MFKIGEFSKINHVTVRTLRHYEERGLITPAETDRFTGYRYYTAGQLAVMEEILAYKRMGFSLDEIRGLLKNGLSAERALEKQAELAAERAETDGKMAELTRWLQNQRGENKMEQVKIQTLPEVLVASYRKVVRSYAEFNELFPGVMYEEMTKMGVTCREPEYCFNIYHDGEYREQDIDVEMCQAVTERRGESALLKYRELPATEAACIRHHGPYDRLRESYAEVYRWISENGYETTDFPREWYINGVWDKDDPEEYLTEIQVPVRKAK